MSVLVANEVPDAMENWDEDFEFQPTQGNSLHTRRSTGSSGRGEILTDDVPPLFKDTKNTLNSRLSLQHWAEPGPSTPSKRVQLQTENWDDDFQEVTDSPIRQHTANSSPRSRRSRRRRPSVPEPENWDDDFEVGKPDSPSTKSARWDSSSDEEEGFGFGERDEDHTVTSRTRRGALPRASVLPNETPPPPVPPIPMSLMSRPEPAPFPGSPTLSAFSVPGSGRDSVAAYSYSSTAHLALRPTISGTSLGALPPSPPIHHARERRRLRKKSRPARVDYNIYELEDRVEVPLRPVTPEQTHPLVDAASPTDTQPESTQSAGKSSLVSRIGSVGKKWGASRKKRASTGPEVVISHERRSGSRPTSMALPSPPSASSKSGWFFRHGGVLGAGSRSPPSQASALPLKHENSVDRLLSLVGIEYDTPSKTRRTARAKDGSSSEYAGTSSDGGMPELPFLSQKRPSSVHVQSTSRRSVRRTTLRHASYNQSEAEHPSSSQSSLVSRSCSASGSVEQLTRKKSRGSVASRDEGKTPKRPSRNSSEHERSRKQSLKMRHKHSLSIAARTDYGDGPRPSTSTTATAVPPRIVPNREDDATPRPPSRILGRPSGEHSLLPPIELQPPSPPRATNGLSTSHSMPLALESLSETRTPVLRPSQSSPLVVSPMKLQKLASSPSPSPSRSRAPISPQSASLGRSTQAPKERELAGSSLLRRNSLGDLKIPERITKAQVGLKQNMGMVREFAANIDRLKELQSTYHLLTSEIQAHLVKTVPAEPKTRATSPILFGLPRPSSRARSKTNPQFLTPPTREEAKHRELLVSFRAIEARYCLSWECAELLIELGGGPPADQDSPEPSVPLSSQSASIFEGRKSRERAVTLAGDEPKPQLTMSNLSHSTLPMMSPSNPSQWRASTGRHDLSHRQLMLLEDMLSSPNASAAMGAGFQVPEEVDRSWRWGDAMNSTVTLPTEESAQGGQGTAGSSGGPPAKKRASSRLRMRGLRDLLRSLKKTYSESSNQSQDPHNLALGVPSSLTSVSISTNSSADLPQSRTVAQRRRAKTSIGPESIRSLKDHPNSPYATTSFVHRSSPRRPSLASIFRLGQKGKASAKSSPQSVGSELPSDSSQHVSSDALRGPSSHHGTEEEWDHIESSSDLDLMSAASTVRAEKSGTVKGRKGRSPYSLQSPISAIGSPSKRNMSRSSIWSTDAQDMSLSEQSPPLPISELHPRTTKLSDVREHAEHGADYQEHHLRKSSSAFERREPGVPRPSPKRPRSRASKITIPPKSAPSGTSQARDGLSPDVSSGNTRFTLAMTPDNIRPLLENAKEVQNRCNECLDEFRQLLQSCQ